jgi:hypothetical protein
MVAAMLSAMPGLTSAANAASGYGPIHNYGASTCLDDPGFSHTSGTRMDSWGCNGGANQQWRVFASRVIDNQFQEYEFQNQASGLCLDMKGGSSANGAPVIQWPCIRKITLNGGRWATLTQTTLLRGLYFSMMPLVHGW